MNNRLTNNQLYGYGINELFTEAVDSYQLEIDLPFDEGVRWENFLTEQDSFVISTLSSRAIQEEFGNRALQNRNTRVAECWSVWATLAAAVFLLLGYFGVLCISPLEDGRSEALAENYLAPHDRTTPSLKGDEEGVDTSEFVGIAPIEMEKLELSVWPNGPPDDSPGTCSSLDDFPWLAKNRLPADRLASSCLNGSPWVLAVELALKNPTSSGTASPDRM